MCVGLQNTNTDATIVFPGQEHIQEWQLPFRLSPNSELNVWVNTVEVCMKGLHQPFELSWASVYKHLLE